MSSISPRITVRIDPEKDIGRFVFFLENENYRAKRPAILTFYPSLQRWLDAGGNPEAVVRRFVLELYQQFDRQIHASLESAERQFAESEPAFRALANLMDFPRLGERSYTAVPTLLPFSPLDDRLFYFSIASTVAGKQMKPRRISVIAVHEISHFIFREQYEAWVHGGGAILNDPTFHYAKEALTAAVLDQPAFRIFYDYPALFRSDGYPGNPELRVLSVTYRGNTTPIVQFVEQQVLQSTDGYSQGVRRLYSVLAKAGEAFSEKWERWNSGSGTGEQTPAFAREYSKPIELVG